jgi:hypothetical protein
MSRKPFTAWQREQYFKLGYYPQVIPWWAKLFDGLPIVLKLMLLVIFGPFLVAISLTVCAIVSLVVMLTPENKFDTLLGLYKERTGVAYDPYADYR